MDAEKNQAASEPVTPSSPEGDGPKSKASPSFEVSTSLVGHTYHPSTSFPIQQSGDSSTTCEQHSSSSSHRDSELPTTPYVYFLNLNGSFQFNFHNSRLFVHTQLSFCGYLFSALRVSRNQLAHHRPCRFRRARMFINFMEEMFETPHTLNFQVQVSSLKGTKITKVMRRYSLKKRKK